jgi:bifunctional non-homologous end joining protein LigD
VHIATGDQRAQLEAATRIDVAWAGHRLALCRLGSDVRLFADDLREWTEPLAPLAVAAGQLAAHELVIDGFACVFDDTGRPDFEALRAWVKGSRQGTLGFMALDLLRLDGVELRALPFAERFGRLEQVLTGAPLSLLLSRPLQGSLSAVLESVRQLQLPGVLVRHDDTLFAVSATTTPLPVQRSLSAAPKVTNPTKVLYPAEGHTKATVSAYYHHVAPHLLPHLRERPIVAQRWPDGIADFTWYQHRVPPRAPDYVKVALIEGDRRLLIDNQEALLWMVNQAALTFHGWASRRSSLLHPDWAVIDLDPGSATTWPQVIEVALAVRALLELLEAPSVVKTSGQKGLHILVPLAPAQSLADAQAFALGVCSMVAQLKPALVSLEAESGPRRGRLYLDSLQNFRGKSLVLPYSLRAVPSASASTPLHWHEVTPTLDPRAFTLRTLPARLDLLGDLFAPALTGSFRLGPALQRLRGQ